MKYRNTLRAALALLTAIGCTQNEVIERQAPLEPEARVLSLTAEMPGGAARTRVSLAKDGDDVALTWVNNDPIQLCFVQGATKIIATTNARDISADGKKAKFDIALPSEITAGDFTLYGLYGPDNALKVEDGKVTATLPTDIIWGWNFDQMKDMRHTLMTFKAENVSATNPKVSASFEHIGSLFNIRVKNSGSAPLGRILKLSPKDASTPTGWVFNNGWMGDPTFGAKYDMEAGDFVSGTVGANYLAFALNGAEIAAGETVDFWAWYPPSKTTAWPELKMEICDMGLNVQQTSVNTKPARSTPLERGKVYRFYALWDGANLKFTDRTFTKPKLPLEYVAEYNLNPAGDGFATTHANNASGYFNWYRATGTVHAIHNPSGENILDKPVFSGWHLPTGNEWYGIICDHWGGADKIVFDYVVNRPDVSEEIEIAGVTQTYTADYKNPDGKGIAYAIKMKGNGDTYRTAYRYKMEGNRDDNNYRLVVRCKYLGATGAATTIDEVANEDFWEPPYDVERVFPACGLIYEGSLIEVGKKGQYWTTMTEGGITDYAMIFKNSWALVDYGWNKRNDYTLRLFSDD